MVFIDFVARRFDAQPRRGPRLLVLPQPSPRPIADVTDPELPEAPEPGGPGQPRAADIRVGHERAEAHQRVLRLCRGRVRLGEGARNVEDVLEGGMLKILRIDSVLRQRHPGPHLCLVELGRHTRLPLQVLSQFPCLRLCQASLGLLDTRKLDALATPDRQIRPDARPGGTQAAVAGSLQLEDQRIASVDRFMDRVEQGRVGDHDLVVEGANPVLLVNVAVNDEPRPDFDDAPVELHRAEASTIAKRVSVSERRAVGHEDIGVVGDLSERIGFTRDREQVERPPGIRDAEATGPGRVVDLQAADLNSHILEVVGVLQGTELAADALALDPAVMVAGDPDHLLSLAAAAILQPVGEARVASGALLIGVGEFDRADVAGDQEKVAGRDRREVSVQVGDGADLHLAKMYARPDPDWPRGEAAALGIVGARRIHVKRVPASRTQQQQLVRGHAGFDAMFGRTCVPLPLAPRVDSCSDVS